MRGKKGGSIVVIGILIKEFVNKYVVKMLESILRESLYIKRERLLRSEK